MKLSVSLGFAPSQVRKWPYSDIIDLMAYDSIEPFGTMRDNMHFAMLARLYVSAHQKKGKPAPELRDFMFIAKEERAKSSQMLFTSWLGAKAKK